MPTAEPSLRPSVEPTAPPSASPSSLPSLQPTAVPSNVPSAAPTLELSIAPTFFPSSFIPSNILTVFPSFDPSTTLPSSFPSTDYPSSLTTVLQSNYPTCSASNIPTRNPSDIPTSHSLRPSLMPSASTRPTMLPSISSNPTVQASLVLTEMPSGYPTHFPSENPTLFPSASSTFVYFIAEQVVDHVDLSQWTSNGTIAFELAVAECMPSISSSDVQIISKTSGTYSNSSRRQLLLLTPYVTVNYTVTFNSAALGYNSTAAAYASLSNQLQSSVQRGNFTQYLRVFGNNLGCSYLGNASSSCINIGPLEVINSAAPTSTPVVANNSNNSNGSQVSAVVVAGLVVIIVVALSVIAAAIYYKVWNNLTTSPEEKWVKATLPPVKEKGSESKNNEVAESPVLNDPEEPPVSNRTRRKDNIMRLINQKSISNMISKPLLDHGSTERRESFSIVNYSPTLDSPSRLSDGECKEDFKLNFEPPRQSETKFDNSNPSPLDISSISRKMSFNEIYNGVSFSAPQTFCDRASFIFSSATTNSSTSKHKDSMTIKFKFDNPMADEKRLSTYKKLSVGSKIDYNAHENFNLTDVYPADKSFTSRESVNPSAKPRVSLEEGLESIYSPKKDSSFSITPNTTENPIARLSNYASSPPTNRTRHDNGQVLTFQNIHPTNDSSHQNASKGDTTSHDFVNPIRRSSTDKVKERRDSHDYSAYRRSSTIYSSLDAPTQTTVPKSIIKPINPKPQATHEPPSDGASDVKVDVTAPSTIQQGWLQSKKRVTRTIQPEPMLPPIPQSPPPSHTKAPLLGTEVPPAGISSTPSHRNSDSIDARGHSAIPIPSMLHDIDGGGGGNETDSDDDVESGKMR